MKKYVKSTKIESSIQVSGYDDASRKLAALSDGEIIQYTGNKLGGVVEAVADALEVGDEFTISAEVGYIAPGPDNDGIRTITTTFLVTDAYRYGNGYAPIYQGRSPKLNADQSRSWRDITNGALWLLGDREYTIVIHKNSQSITSATAVEGDLHKYYKIDRSGEYADPEFDQDIIDILAENDLTFQGWAVAKAKYYDILADDGLDTAAIATDKQNQNGLYYIVHDIVYPVTVEEIERIVRNRSW